MTSRAASTKEKLSTIVDGFDTFENDMIVGSRVRREKEERKVRELAEEMGRLEGQLAGEEKRRTDMNRATELVREPIFVYIYIFGCVTICIFFSFLSIDLSI